MLCSLCGENNASEATVCQRCGQKLVSRDEPSRIVHRPGSLAPASGSKSLRRVSLKRQTEAMRRISAKLPRISAKMQRIFYPLSPEQRSFTEQTAASEPKIVEELTPPAKSSLPPTNSQPFTLPARPPLELLESGVAGPPADLSAMPLVNKKNTPLPPVMSSHVSTQKALSTPEEGTRDGSMSATFASQGGLQRLLPVENVSATAVSGLSKGAVDDDPPQRTYLANMSVQFRELYDEQENATPSEVIRAYRPQPPRIVRIAISTLVIIVLLLGSVGIWYFWPGRVSSDAGASSPGNNIAANAPDPCSGGIAGHDLGCWNTNIDLTFSGAISGHVTAVASCTIFLDADSNGQSNQHIICDTVNAFPLGKQLYRFSWFIYHYRNPGNYGTNGDVNALMPQMGSQPLLMWTGETNPQDSSATVGSDKLSGTLNLKLLPRLSSQSGTPTATPSSLSPSSAVAISGSWAVVPNSCRNAPSASFCP